MKKLYFSILSLSFSLLSFSQSKDVIIKGTVTDINKRGIPYSTIQNVVSKSLVSADTNGAFVFKTKIPSVIKVSHVGYLSQQIKITSFQDTIMLNFILEPYVEELKTVDVVDIYKPEIVKKSQTLLDFETKNNLIWLLYDYGDGSKIEIRDTSSKIVCENYYKKNMLELNKTQHAFIYSKDKDSVYIHQYTNNKLTSFSVSIDFFETKVSPVKAYHFPYYYYYYESPSKARVAYFYFNNQDSSQQILYKYKNTDIYNSNKEIYQQIYGLQYLLSDENGFPKIMGDVYVNTQEDFRSAEKKIMVLNLMVQHIYCPLRIIKDSIYVFNFENDSIYVFNNKNVLIHKIPLGFDHSDRKYKNKDILVDDGTNECYFKYEKNGITFIEKINLNSGLMVNSYTLKQFPFIEKIRISEGYAYFMYYDNNSGYFGERYLYKQKIH